MQSPGHDLRKYPMLFNVHGADRGIISATIFFMCGVPFLVLFGKIATNCRCWTLVASRKFFPSVRGSEMFTPTRLARIQHIFSI
jgi:hypothetical protein